MRTKVSTDGQVALPETIRRELGVSAGDFLDAKIEGGRIVLTPESTHKWKVEIITDPLSGYPVLSAGPDAPILTNKEVEEILSDFT